jgi:hypothetical protein
MPKLQDWDVCCVNPYLATMIHHAKSITSDGWEAKEALHPSLDYAQNITEAIPVFMDLEEKHLRLDMVWTKNACLNLR